MAVNTGSDRKKDCTEFLFKMYLYENFLKGAVKRAGTLAINLGGR